MSKIKPVSNQRLMYLDLLRVVITFCMIMLHAASVGLDGGEIGTFTWHVCNVYDGITHICVPVFIMISGAFLLDPQKEYPLEKLYKVKILRIVTAFVFWSFVYASLKAFHRKLPFGKEFVIAFGKDFIKGEFHLWFMFTIAGLYILTPIIRKITADKKITEYFLLVCGVFMFVISNISAYSLNPTVDEVFYYVNQKLNMQFVFGYTFYYVAGCYFRFYSPSRKLKSLLYFGSLVSLVAIPLGTYYYSSTIGANYLILYGFESPFIGVLSLGTFVLFKDLFAGRNFGEKTTKVIILLSKYSFGVYLVHVVVRTYLFFNCYSFNPIFSVPIVAAVTFLISLVITWVIGRIPVLNKYIM